MLLCYISVTERKSPIMGEFLGYRGRACIPNMAGRNMKGEAIPSFTAQYLVATGSDCENLEQAFASVINELQNLKFTHISIVEDLEKVYAL